MISVIIVTHNNYGLKNGCIESVILSLLVQKNIELEIIVVDNASSDEDVEQLENYIFSLKNKSIVLVKNVINNISSGRNLGAKFASGNILVYMDDDMILPNKNIIFRLGEFAANHIYGYAAVRQWTEENWYNRNKNEVNELLISDDDEICIRVSRPNPEIRRKKIDRHLIRTYIGNFGFIRKEALTNIGFWDEQYKGYGFEDDAMALKLYLMYGRPKVMDQITVIHIWHAINEKNYVQLEMNRILYEKTIKELGIKCFHVGRLMYEEEGIIDSVKE
ncbi:glycosyltransferase family 2 protein [Blautia sp.]|uniref:glycosyltransferase family 2 protein n=1 Tax=Blautia sp. TaxID=1955243 RepID=UPI002673D5B9|nr:glycosyltransferase family 2 protein [uncultured Blautia sp.]